MLPVTTSSTCLPAASTDQRLQVGSAAVIRKLMFLFPELSERQSDAAAMTREWAKDLADLELQEIERGLRAMRNCRFAPNIGEFRCLCRPALNPEYAWHEAYAGLQARERGEVGEWSHPGVWRAAKALSWDLKRKSFAQMRGQWEFVLNRELAAGWGEEVPAPAPRISYEPPAQDGPTVSAENRQRLAELARSFKVGTTRRG